MQHISANIDSHFVFCFVCILFLPAGVNLSRLIVTDIACSRWARRATSCRQWRNLTSNQSPLQHPLEYILYQLFNTNRVNLLTPLQHPHTPQTVTSSLLSTLRRMSSERHFFNSCGPFLCRQFVPPQDVFLLFIFYLFHFLCCKMTGRRLIENCVRLQTPDWPGQARSWHSEIEGAVEQSLCPHLCSQSTFISTMEEYREESVIKELFVFLSWNLLRKRRCFFLQPKITVFLPIFINNFYSAKRNSVQLSIFSTRFWTPGDSTWFFQEKEQWLRSNSYL